MKININRLLADNCTQGRIEINLHKYLSFVSKEKYTKLLYRDMNVTVRLHYGH